MTTNKKQHRKATLHNSLIASLVAACGLILAITACSDNETTLPDPDDGTTTTEPDSGTTTTEPDDGTTTTEPDDGTTITEPDPTDAEEDQSDPEALELLNSVLDQPTSYSMSGQAKMSLSPAFLFGEDSEDPLSANGVDDPDDADLELLYEQNAEALAQHVVFRSDTEGDIYIRPYFPTGLNGDLNGDLPEDGDHGILYVGDSMFFRGLPVDPDDTATDEQGWLEYELIDETQTLFDRLSCIFFVPDPEADPDSGRTSPTRCNLQNGLHDVLSNTRNAQIVGTEVVSDVQTTKLSFSFPLFEEVDEATRQVLPRGQDPSDTTSTGTAETDLFYQQFEALIDSYLDRFFALTLESNVWIDENNRVRRIDIDFTEMLSTMFFLGLGPSEESEQEPAVLTLEIQDFDADISVEAPDPEDIGRLTTTTQQNVS